MLDVPSMEGLGLALRSVAFALCMGLDACALLTSAWFDEWSEPWLQLAIKFDMFEKHCIRAHPQASLVVERTVHDQWLKRFAVAGYAHYLVFATLVVTIATEPDFRKGSKITHWNA